LRSAIDRLNPKCELEVDGGIDRHTITEAATAGATVFVAGTAVFGDPAGPTATTRHLLQLAGG
jgi:ribulose-phosphate 3-epimerase